MKNESVFYTKDGKFKSPGYRMPLLSYKFHRLNGPAFIFYNGIGIIKEEYWYQNGMLHREDRPATIIRYPDFDSLSYVIYQNKGLFHRINGPCYIHYDTSGKILKEKWYVNGTQVPLEFLEENDIDPYNITKEDEFLINMKF